MFGLDDAMDRADSDRRDEDESRMTPEQEAISAIRDRIANTPNPATGFVVGLGVANAILAACPEIAALDNAREGWIRDSGYGDVVIFAKPLQYDGRVGVIPWEELQPKEDIS